MIAEIKISQYQTDGTPGGFEILLTPESANDRSLLHMLNAYSAFVFHQQFNGVTISIAKPGDERG